MPDHPMDDIPVRPLRFDFSEMQSQEVEWSRSSPDFSVFINALGVHVPYFERFLVGVMREYRDELASPLLKKEVQAIIGQESHHAFNFVNWTKVLAQHYPGIGKLDEKARDYFQTALTRRDKRFKIGFTAGYETFTFLSGMIILNRYEELMADADPHLRALWVWHQVEEVEHGAVAFDFYRAFYPDDEWYRRYMVLFAFVHIASETFLAFRAMVRGRTLTGKLRGWRFFASFATDLFLSSLPVLSRNYHPRHHPICNEEQNEVAVLWRNYFASGGDATSLAAADMALIFEGNLQGEQS